MSEDTVPVSLDWHIVSLSSVEFILVAVYSSPGSTSPTCETHCYSEHSSTITCPQVQPQNTIISKYISSILTSSYTILVALPNTYNTNFAFKSFIIVAITLSSALAIILHYHCRFNFFSAVYRSILICIVL